MNELHHWGIKGMKWGIRRYQNQDGTLTSEGKVRYKSIGDYLTKLSTQNRVNNLQDAYDESKHRTKKYETRMAKATSDKKRQKYEKKIEKEKYAQANLGRAVGLNLKTAMEQGYSVIAKPKEHKLSSRGKYFVNTIISDLLYGIHGNAVIRGLNYYDDISGYVNRGRIVRDAMEMQPDQFDEKYGKKGGN